MPWSSSGMKPDGSCVFTRKMPTPKPVMTSMVSARRVTIRRRNAA